jgi:hypothetical protein
MQAIEDLCYKIDKKRENSLEALKRSKKCREIVNNKNDMNKQERNLYNTYVRNQKEKYTKPKVWQKLLT